MIFLEQLSLWAVKAAPGALCATARAEALLAELCRQVNLLPAGCCLALFIISLAPDPPELRFASEPSSSPHPRPTYPTFLTKGAIIKLSCVVSGVI
jgi:hypothetical protein